MWQAFDWAKTKVYSKLYKNLKPLLPANVTNKSPTAIRLRAYFCGYNTVSSLHDTDDVTH